MNNPRAFYIAGVKFHKLSTVINELEVGQVLDLIPEPENKFDPNAVAIKYNDIMLGYVPRTISAEISALLEIEELFCVIDKLTPSAKPWEQCKVTIMDWASYNEKRDYGTIEDIH